MKQSPLDYVPGNSVIPSDAFGISPSNVFKFFDKPHEWYNEQILGNTGFTGSTSTVLGTIVHYCAEQFATTQSVDKSHIYQYIANQCCNGIIVPSNLEEEEIEEFLVDNQHSDDIDASTILENYKPMGNAIISHLRSTGLPSRTEELISAEVIPGYYACGSADAVRGQTLIDYKTCGPTGVKSTIPYNYKLQLLTYAWIYRQNGIPISSIQIIWINRPDVDRYGKNGNRLKDYPAAATTVTLSVDDHDIDFIESLLKLISETVAHYRANPEQAYLLFKDYRLKGN